MSAASTPARRPTMRRTIWLAWLLGGLVLGAALTLLLMGERADDTLRGSGRTAEQARVVPAFRGVELAGSNVVTIQVGGPRSVTVRGDDNLLSHVTTRVRSGRLVVDAVGGVSTKAPMRVLVTTPSLDALALSGSGVVTVRGVRARTLAVTLSGSGVLHAAGTADRLTASLDGSGVAQLGALVAREVRATVAGSGRMDVTATRALRASVPGTGAIFYGGDPDRVTTRITGMGAIVRR